VANESFAYTHVFCCSITRSECYCRACIGRQKQGKAENQDSVDSPALLLPPSSPQPILDSRTATSLTVRDFQGIASFYTKRERTCRSVMDSRRRITLQLPQHRATKYRVTLLWPSPARAPNDYERPLGSSYYSMNRPDKPLVCTLRHAQ
jgi:hypothetical protein